VRHALFSRSAKAVIVVGVGVLAVVAMYYALFRGSGLETPLRHENDRYGQNATAVAESKRTAERALLADDGSNPQVSRGAVPSLDDSVNDGASTDVNTGGESPSEAQQIEERFVELSRLLDEQKTDPEWAADAESAIRDALATFESDGNRGVAKLEDVVCKTDYCRVIFSHDGMESQMRFQASYRPGFFGAGSTRRLYNPSRTEIFFARAGKTIPTYARLREEGRL
jgi:hypothetical protein